MELETYLNQYGETLLTFEHYYKYSFTYSGKASDGMVVKYTYGGCGDDIYRYEVTLDAQTLYSFAPDSVERFGDELWFK